MVNNIESKDNPKIKDALKLATDASYRRKSGLFFASTRKVVLDIMAAGFSPVSVFVVAPEYEKIKDRLDGVQCFIISEAVSQKLSESKTEDGVFAVFKMQKRDETQLFRRKKLLVLEDIQDPNNMGAIMRTALAFGYEDVVVSEKCADVYSRKVVRTSMTASVKLNVYRVGDIAGLTQRLNSQGFCTVAACLEGAQELGTVPTTLPLALYIGNEGNGLSDEVIQRCTLRLKIPMSDRIESLNAAVSAAVLMWELRNE